jgi:excisionase family DNA binding protein
MALTSVGSLSPWRSGNDEHAARAMRRYRQPGPPEEAQFYTVSETAQYLRLCEKQVRRLISRGELPAYRFDTALRIKRQDINAYAESRRIHPV